MPNIKPTVNLPNNEKTFHLSVRGETSNKQYEGKFRIIRMPNVGQKAEAALIQARLNQDLTSLDPSIKLFHNMVAQCRVRVVEAPQWWIDANFGQDLFDLNIVYEVFKECLQAEKEWREEIWGPEETKSEPKPSETEEKKE